MGRFLLTMLFYVIVGRWIYAEMNIVCPWAVPSVDRVLVSLEIPTHNSWSEDGIRGIVQEANTMFNHISYNISKSGILKTSGRSTDTLALRPTNL